MIPTATILTRLPCAPISGVHPAEGEYARTFLLPLVGPSAYLVWNTLSRGTRPGQPTSWTTCHLAASVGISQSMLGRTLDRAQAFRLLDRYDDIDGQWVYAVLCAPSLSLSALDRLEASCPPLRELHRVLHEKVAA